MGNREYIFTKQMNRLHLYILCEGLRDYIITNYPDPVIELSKGENEILNLWDEKFQKAIVEDFNSAFKNIEFVFLPSIFEMEAEDEQGSPSIFLHHIIIIDKDSNASLKAFIKSLIFLDKINIYLDSEYANKDNLGSESEVLNKIFLQLKKADKNAGYFNPVSFKNFICNLV
jgi:hypothetical protein